MSTDRNIKLLQRARDAGYRVECIYVLTVDPAINVRRVIKRNRNGNDIEIIEGKMMPDHVHLLVSIPLKMSVSSFIGNLKGKSALMMFDKHANLK